MLGPERCPARLRPRIPAVTDLTGRTFAAWTLTTCLLCIVCARNPCNASIYGETGQPAGQTICSPASSPCLPLLLPQSPVERSAARAPALNPTRTHPAPPPGATLLSFVVAIVHFTAELLVFKTMDWQFALQPMVVAGEGGSGWFRVLINTLGKEYVWAGEAA